MSAPTALPAQASPDGRRHIAALDGVRGLAILMVMFYHMTVLPPAGWIDTHFLELSEIGASGVALFFVLSGFLITGILLEAKGQPHFFRSFYARRVLRIFPLYYAVVFISFVVLPHFHNAKIDRFGKVGNDKIWYWLYLSNFSTAFRNQWRHGILDVAWSLAIEEQFYLVWPAIVLWFSRRALSITCAALIVLSLVTRIVLLHLGYGLIPIVTLTPCRLEGLAAGAWIAIAVQNGTLDKFLRFGPWLWVPSIAFMLWAHHAPDVWETSLIAQSGEYTAETALFAVALSAAVACPAGRWAGMLSNGWLGMFGRYSYALYLFHLPLRAAVRDLVFSPVKIPAVLGSHLPGQILFYPLATAVSLAAAWLSWNLYESQFLRLKRFFPMPHKHQDPNSILDGRT